MVAQVSRLKSQLQKGGGGGAAVAEEGSGTLLYVLIAVIVLLLGMVAKLTLSEEAVAEAAETANAD